jgi:hypothetical protein
LQGQRFDRLNVNGLIQRSPLSIFLFPSSEGRSAGHDRHDAFAGPMIARRASFATAAFTHSASLTNNRSVNIGGLKSAPSSGFYRQGRALFCHSIH